MLLKQVVFFLFVSLAMASIINSGNPEDEDVNQFMDTESLLEAAKLDLINSENRQNEDLKQLMTADHDAAALGLLNLDHQEDLKEIMTTDHDAASSALLQDPKVLIRNKKNIIKTALNWGTKILGDVTSGDVGGLIKQFGELFGSTKEFEETHQIPKDTAGNRIIAYIQTFFLGQMKKIAEAAAVQSKYILEELEKLGEAMAVLISDVPKVIDELIKLTTGQAKQTELMAESIQANNYNQNENRKMLTDELAKLTIEHAKQIELMLARMEATNKDNQNENRKMTDELVKISAEQAKQTELLKQAMEANKDNQIEYRRDQEGDYKRDDQGYYLNVTQIVLLAFIALQMAFLHRK